LLAFELTPNRSVRPRLGFTRRFAEAGEHGELEIVDHMIVGNGGRRVSLKTRGGW
jgi:DNA repair protein RadC